MRNDNKEQVKEGRLSSVAAAMRVLKAFSDHEPELGIAALAAKLGMAKSTVHRLAATLLDAGMLDQNDENGKYRLGLTVFELGSLARRRMDIYNEARNVLRDLRAATGESVNLAIMRDDCLIYLNSLESAGAVKIRSHMGLRLPAHCAAEGKVLLAFAAPEDAARVAYAGLAALTPNTITEPEALLSELRVVRERGYATDYEESELGLRAIAAPVFSGAQTISAAIGIAGPLQRLNKRTLLGFLPALIEAADGISQRLGASRPAARTLQVARA